MVAEAVLLQLSFSKYIRQSCKIMRYLLFPVPRLHALVESSMALQHQIFTLQVCEATGMTTTPVTRIFLALSPLVSHSRF